MCTLTLLREPWLRDADPRPRWRLVFNRDERRSRLPAIPPDRHRAGGVQVLHPVDPQGGGTWIAATEYGVVFAVLNGNDPQGPDVPEAGEPLSRGSIIPALAATPARRAAEVRTQALDPRAYRPFHLVIADDRETIEITSDGTAIVSAPPDAGDRLIRTSSSHESSAVRAWRTSLFAPPHTPASVAEQDAFHVRAEPGRPAYGVAMARADACTVSITTVDVFADAVRMAYRPIPGADATHVTELARAT